MDWVPQPEEWAALPAAVVPLPSAWDAFPLAVVWLPSASEQGPEGSRLQSGMERAFSINPFSSSFHPNAQPDLKRKECGK